MDLFIELQEELEKLNKSVENLRKSGSDYAYAERDYKIILRQECLKLKDEKMAVGLIEKVCYGIPVVADARCERDIKQAVYKANLEAINSIKLNIKIIENQINREFTTYDTKNQ